MKPMLKEDGFLTENRMERWIMNYFSGLLSILEEQTRCYEKIYRLKEREQQLVLSGTAEELQSNTAEIDAETLTIRSLEKARLELMDSLAQQYRLNAGPVTFQQVMELADNPCSGELQSIATRLVGVLERTSRINEDNAYLIRRSLDVIERSLDILTGATARRDTYSAQGTMEPQRTASLVVNRQA